MGFRVKTWGKRCENTKINQIMAKKDMTTRELSRLSGVSTSTILRVRNGWSMQTSGGLLSRLAQALGVSVDEILDC